MSRIIRVQNLSLVPNVCNQRLREVWKNDHASLAHVTMPLGNQSLLHQHKKFIEWYYILNGQGIMEVDNRSFKVRGGDMIYILPREKHRLTNVGKSQLQHLVFSTPPFSSNDVFDSRGKRL
jgi:mannose-6-phosphate isomerase-like protein (cupin superfamily)